MEILRKSKEDLTAREQYKLTKNKKSISVKDAVGMQIKVNLWCQYQDQNQKGETVTVLAIMADDGEVYTTVSNVFTRSFFDIVDTFKDDLPEIIIIDGQTNAGRTYYDCTIE